MSVDLIKVLKELGNEMVTELLEAIRVEESIRFEWENSETMPICVKGRATHWIVVTAAELSY